MRTPDGGKQETPFSIEGMQVAGGSIQQIVMGRCLFALSVVTLTAALCAEDSNSKPGLFGYAVAQQSESQQPESQQSESQQSESQGSSSKALRQQAIAGLPTARLTRQAQDRILAIANSPTIYRRLPTQAIDCDRNMFLFLARNPEVMVGMWELMGITKVKTNRTGPYQLDADDGSGTKCNVDLVYGDPNVHVYVTEGSYDGMLTVARCAERGW